MATYPNSAFAQAQRETKRLALKELPTSLRRCLKCEAWMRSTGPDHRVCNPCKGIVHALPMSPGSRLGPTDRKKLIAGIHAQAKTLQLDHDTRREMQRQLVGVESSKDMSLGQLSTIWHRLTVLAADAGLGRAARGTRRPGRDERMPDELVTEEQKMKINELFDAIGIAAVGQARMNFSRRTCGHTWPQTREQANKIVEALKAMAKRGWKATEPSALSDHPSAPSHEGEKEEV